MQDVKFTKGPWQFGHLGTEALWIGPDYRKTPVAHVDHDMEYARDNSIANARLISAAPDLFEVARRLVGLEADDGGRRFPSKEDIAAARAALSKATGQP